MTEEKRFELFRITDIERAFSLYPGTFDSLPEAIQWRLIDYWNLMTDGEARLFNCRPIYLSLSATTPAAEIMMHSQRTTPTNIPSPVANPKQQNLMTGGKVSIPLYMFGDQ